MRKILGVFVTMAVLLPAMVPASGNKEHILWRSEDDERVLRAILVQDVSNGHIVEKMLVGGAQDLRVVLSYQISADPAEHVVKMVSDETGWWVAFTAKYSFAEGSLHDYFRRVKGDVAEGDHSVEVSVATSMGLIYSETRRIRDFGLQEQVDSFVASVLESPGVKALRKEVPKDVQELSLFLDGLAYPKDGTEYDGAALAYADLAKIVAGVLRSGGVEDRWAGLRWTSERTHAEIGTNWTTTPEGLEFVSRFKTVDNVDILLGDRPEGIRPDRR